MRRKLLGSILISYITFLGVSFLIVLFVVPRVFRHYLFEISEDIHYRRYLYSQSVAIQNVCYLLVAIIFLLSLFPIAVVHLKLYRPLSRIAEAASHYMDGTSHPQLTYDKDDELGRLAATLNYLIDSADSSTEYQRNFISNVSHDFRSPLTSIHGYVEAMLDGTIPPEMQERYLRIVLGETERLNKLTEGLLLLNTFDGNGVYLEMTQFDISEVIRQTVDTFEVICAKKNLTVQTSFPAKLPLVYADMGRIQQVIYNLLDNAIKFSYPGKEILISVTTRRNLVYVSVKDFGEGIPKENLNKIWDRFYKTDASRGRDKKGTGLGLSIVKEIIRAHHQNINVVSTEGAGTEFIFSLVSASS